MRRVRQILLLGALGALLSFLLSCAIFAIVGLADGGNAAEVLVFAIFLGIGAAFVGAVVGAFVAMLRASWLGGAAIGFAAILLYIVIYAFSSGGLSGFTRFLGESNFFLVLYGIPVLLTGIVTATVRTRQERQQATVAAQPAAGQN